MFALKPIGRLGLVAAIAAFAIAAVACGDDDDDDVDGAATPAAPSTPVSPASSPTAVTTDAGTGTTVQVAQSSLGAILTDDAGLTLYTNNNDTAGSGASVCEAGCPSVWPPLAVTGEPTKPADVPGELGTITRTDGSTQVTYKGLPLYRFVNDAQPGDTNGQGFAGVWTVAQP